MQENATKKLYKSKNVQTETYTKDDAFITKHYYDNKINHVKERILTKGPHKEVNSFNKDGVLAKSENFLNDIRDGLETKYIVSRANKSIKSTKNYSNGKLHGQSTTYNLNGDIIKQELFAVGKPVFKYLRDETFEIMGIEMIDKDNIDKLPTIDAEKLREYMSDKPEWFTT